MKKSSPSSYQSIIHLLLMMVPRAVRQEVRRLEEFVATAQMSPIQLERLRTAWSVHAALPMAQLGPEPTDTTAQRIAKNMARQKIMYQYEAAWFELFFEATAWRFSDKAFPRANMRLKYLYGSGDVLGMMVAKLFRLPRKALHGAAMQARAARQLELLMWVGGGRAVFTKKELASFGLQGSDRVTAMKQPEEFSALLHAELKLYESWRRQAEKAFAHIPQPYRRASMGFADITNRIARGVARTPKAVFDRSVYPSRRLVVGVMLARLFD